MGINFNLNLLVCRLDSIYLRNPVMFFYLKACLLLKAGLQQKLTFITVILNGKNNDR